jgi:hypothetical protein
MRLTSSGLEVKQSQLIGYSSYAGIGTNGLAVAGNVGIGTSSPGAKLDVFGNGNIVRYGDGTNTFNVRFKGPNNWDQQLDTAADKFSIRRNSVDFVVVDSSGNLGIGTSSPAGKLSSVVTAAGAASLTLERTASSRFEFQQGITAVTGDALRIIDTTLSRDYLMLRDGNLGIGTISPGQKLEVAGNILINTSGNPTMTVKTSGAGNNPGYLLTADTNTWGMYGIFSDANDTLQWQYNGTTRLTLTNDGNLGLGVTPSAWVEGVGLNVGSGRGGSIFTETVNFGFTTFNANAFYSSTSTWKYVTSNAASRYQQLNGVHSWYNAPSGTAGNVISFTQAMTLDASGNLSLGQTSSALQSGGTGITLYGSSNSEIKFLNSSTGSASTDGTALLTSSTDFVINNREAGAITFGTSNTERARITSGGVLDIGTGAGAVGQIQFPATQVASANANTLDDYEEGTWTPSIGGTATYTYQTGRYTKIGRMVYVSAIFQVNTIGTGSTSQISGLPFSGASGYTGAEASFSVSYFASIASNVVTLYANAVSASVQFYGLTAAANGTSTISPFQNGARIDFAGWYIAAN